MKRIYNFEKFSKNETRMFAGDTGWHGPSYDIPSEADEISRKTTYDLFSSDGEWLTSGDETKIGLSFHPDGVFRTGGKAYTSKECYVTKREGGGPVPDGPRYTISNNMLWGPQK